MVVGQASRYGLLNLMAYATNGVNKYVFLQGDKEVSSFFVIDEGECEVIIDGISRLTLKPGEIFGEKALMHDNPRSATIQATPHSKFWVLDKKSFQVMLGVSSQRNFNKNRLFIEQIPLFGKTPLKWTSFTREPGRCLL